MCLSREGAKRADRQPRGPGRSPGPFPPVSRKQSGGERKPEETQSEASRGRVPGAGRGQWVAAGKGGKEEVAEETEAGERPAEPAPGQPEVRAPAAHKGKRRRGALATCAGAAFSSSSIGSSCATAAAVGGDLDMSLWTIGEKSAPSSRRPFGVSPPPLPDTRLPAPRCPGGSVRRCLAIRARDGAGPFGEATHTGEPAGGRGDGLLLGCAAARADRARSRGAQGLSSPRGRELAQREARGRRLGKRE